MNVLTALARIIVAGIIFLLPATQPGAQEKAAAAGNQKEAVATPGPEMDQLKFLRGYWHYVSTYEKSSFHPEGGKGSGSYIITEGPGGFSQIAEFSGTSPDGREVGHEVTTWDPEEHAYKSYVFGNNFPGCIVRTGKWDGNTLIFDADFYFNGVDVHLQSSMTANADGTVTIVEKFATNDGELQPTLTLKATRERF
ncbi:MAG TPA: DUF1579 family protein [Candidatus Acidoferrales bacterium]